MSRVKMNLIICLTRGKNLRAKHTTSDVKHIDARMGIQTHNISETNDFLFDSSSDLWQRKLFVQQIKLHKTHSFYNVCDIEGEKLLFSMDTSNDVVWREETVAAKILRTGWSTWMCVIFDRPLLCQTKHTSDVHSENTLSFESKRFDQIHWNIQTFN